MIAYWLLVVIVIVILCLAVWGIRRWLLKDNSTDLSAAMITTGITLVASAFPGIKEICGAILACLFKINVQIRTDYVAIVCGFALIALGIFYNHTIKDRVFVLNMLGMFSQLEISDERYIKQLRLADFKVKEKIIDFVDVFTNGAMSPEKNSIIVQIIKKQCESFKSKSVDFNSCFTGMAPIPYTILAGYYLSGGSIKRFFEYNGKQKKYVELQKRKWFHKYPEIKVFYPQTVSVEQEEIIVALSISMNVQDSDIVQFKNDVIRIGLDEPINNVIQYIEQLEDYCNVIITEIEKVKVKYPKLKTIHLVASIPSCVSEKIGEMLSLRTNRIPQVIAYHYINGSNPKYPFGIIVSDISSDSVGKLVVPEMRCK